jgi:hypothetical protein
MVEGSIEPRDFVCDLWKFKPPPTSEVRNTVT